MKQLHRYVAKHVVAAILLVMVVLTGLFAVEMFAKEMGDIPKDYSLLNVVIYVLLRMPGMVVHNAGFILLIGCLMGLGVLASQSELTVIRASGVSVARIVWMVIKPTLAVIALVCLAGEFVVPSIDRYANHYRAEKVEQEAIYNLIRSQHGLWMRQGNDFIHFNDVDANGNVYGFARLSFDERGELLFGQYASRAVHNGKSAAQQPGWQLENVKTTRFESDKVVASAEENFWRSELEAGLLAVVATDPDEMSVRELRYYMGYLQGQGQDEHLFALVFWKKTLQPLAMIGLVLVAISFIFGPLRDTTMGYRLFCGVMLGLVFRFGQDLLGPTSMVYGFSPWLAVAVPIAVSWLLGAVLLLRTR